MIILTLLAILRYLDFRDGFEVCNVGAKRNKKIIHFTSFILINIKFGCRFSVL